MKHTVLPVFPNWYPFNDMVLDGHLKVGRYAGVKTRSWNWDYRGPVLLYNSCRTVQAAVSAYGYHDAPSGHKVIIGVGELVEVRPLTGSEALRMVCNFNNLPVGRVKKMLALIMQPDEFLETLYRFYALGNYIAPYRIGFFFKNLARFKEPVKFKWSAGPVKPVETKIIAGSPLAMQLRIAGF